MAVPEGFTGSDGGTSSAGPEITCASWEEQFGRPFTSVLSCALWLSDAFPGHQRLL